MSVQHKVGYWAALLLSCAPPAYAAGSPDKSIKFDQAFSAVGAPASLHYEASFTSNGSTHRLQAWRAGDTRVKRATDGIMEVYATRRPGRPEFAMSVLDLKRRIHTRIDRTNMFRIGNFTDWFDLANSLKHPRADYRLTQAAPPPTAQRPIRACRWYNLTQPGRVAHICWDSRDQIPLEIVSQDHRSSWRVTEIDNAPISPAVFRINDAGFVRNDANRDIAND